MHLFKVVHVWIRSSSVPTMMCLILLLLAIHVATFRPLHVVSGWLGRRVAFFGKAYAQYAIADAVAWLAVPEWRAHPANSTPNSLYNRWHYCWLFRNCVWSHCKFLMCFLHASEIDIYYSKWYICAILYIHVYLDTWTSSCATPLNFYKKDPKVHLAQLGQTHSVKSSKVMLTEVPMDVPVEDACSSDRVG